MPMRRPRREPLPDINERLYRFENVRVIGSDGSQLGVMTSRSAVEKARESGLDLVLVAEKADPAVVKIVDYGKHKYEQSKLKKDKKPKGQDVKGIKLSPNIAEHDIQTLIGRAKKFLTAGDKVRVVCRFRQRELKYPDVGKNKILHVVEELAEFGKADKEPTLSGREMVVVINPVVGAVKKEGKVESKKDSEAKDLQDGGQEV
ncbi:MAG: translation initiation factor IF-3 [Armatimonadetes bacterium]|nr:translation initiation factor IF-3 [Armatimonadota bacterium]